MTKTSDLFPQVYFGPVDTPPVDWRKDPKPQEPDDDEDRPPLKSVVQLLKLDPYKLFRMPSDPDER